MASCKRWYPTIHHGHTTSDTMLTVTLCILLALCIPCSFAAENGLEEEMKLALFSAYFTDGKNINDLGVLVALAQAVGLDKSDAEQALKSEKYAQAVREEETIWMQRGIQSVPTFVIGNQGVAGAQEPTTLAAFIAQAASQQ